MDKERLREAVKLCLAVYRLTDNFPAGEILKKRIRESALSFLEMFISDDADGIIKQVRMLGCLFILAQKQGWVGAENYGILFSAFKSLLNVANGPAATIAKTVQIVQQKGEEEKIEAEKKIKTSKGSPSKKGAALTDRQKSIAGLLGGKINGINFGAITTELGKRGFMDVTARTIRNDLRQMVEFGVIEQAGWAKKSFYKLKR